MIVDHNKGKPKSPKYKQGWEAGTWKTCCQRCGRLRRNYQLKKEWTGLMCCETCWETKHPQDEIKAVKDDINVPFSFPQVVNLDPVDVFDPYTESVLASVD